MDLYSGYGFAVFVHMVVASMNVAEFVEYLIYWHGILSNMTSDQGPCFMAKEVHELVYDHKILWSHIVALRNC